MTKETTLISFVLRNNGNFIEVDFFQKNKAGNVVCGDCFMSQKLKGEGRVISVLSDGLGSGIKACVLSTMTATMAMNFTAMNESILRTSTSIMNTLPKDMVRKIVTRPFCICDIDCFGNVKIINTKPPVLLFIPERAFRQHIQGKNPSGTGRP